MGTGKFAAPSAKRAWLRDDKRFAYLEVEDIPDLSSLYATVGSVGGGGGLGQLDFGLVTEDPSTSSLDFGGLT